MREDKMREDGKRDVLCRKTLKAHLPDCQFVMKIYLFLSAILCPLGIHRYLLLFYIWCGVTLVLFVFFIYDCTKRENYSLHNILPSRCFFSGLYWDCSFISRRRIWHLRLWCVFTWWECLSCFLRCYGWALVINFSALLWLRLYVFAALFWPLYCRF